MKWQNTKTLSAHKWTWSARTSVSHTHYVRCRGEPLMLHTKHINSILLQIFLDSFLFYLFFFFWLNRCEKSRHKWDKCTGVFHSFIFLCHLLLGEIRTHLGLCRLYRCEYPSDSAVLVEAERSLAVEPFISIDQYLLLLQNIPGPGSQHEPGSGVFHSGPRLNN